MLFANKQIKGLEDIKGLKVRSTGTSAKVVAALDESMKGFRLAEVISHSTEYGSAYINANYIVINKKSGIPFRPRIRKL